MDALLLRVGKFLRKNGLLYLDDYAISPYIACRSYQLFHIL